jgi:hypothetical protein
VVDRSSSAQWRGGGIGGARAGPDAAFYRQMEKRRKARASSASALSCYGVATKRLRRSGRGAGGRHWQCRKQRGTRARS